MRSSLRAVSVGQEIEYQDLCMCYRFLNQCALPKPGNGQCGENLAVSREADHGKFYQTILEGPIF